MLTSSYPRFPGDIAGTFVQFLAEGLEELGHRVQVVAPADPRAGTGRGVTRFGYSPVRWLQPMGYGKALVNDRRLRAAAVLCSLPYFLAGLKQFVQTARAHHADVLQAHWLLPNGPIATVAATLLKRPLILTLHGSDVFLARRARVLTPVVKGSLRAAAAVTACSPEHIAYACHAGISAQRVHLVPWGADPRRFSGVTGARWRERLAIAPCRPVVLALGRMVEKKGFDYLPAAFAGACATRPPGPDAGPVLVLAGDGPLRIRLERTASALLPPGAYRFTGSIPSHEVPGLLAASTVVVAPSVIDASGNADGLPTVILEAMAAGRPVVASNLGGTPLAVDHGRTGLLVPPGNSDALAAAMGSLLADPGLARTMGALARQRVKQELNWRVIAQRYIDIFEQAVSGTRPMPPERRG